MSLINEALKKAQRLRTEDQASTAGPPAPGAVSASIPKRAQARSANTMVLIGAGALVLVVISVVATVYLLNRPAAPNPAPVIAAPPATSSTSEPAIAPPVIVPPVVVAPPVITPAPAPAPASELATNSATAAETAPDLNSPPIASTPPSSSTATTPSDASTLPATSTGTRATPAPSSPPTAPANTAVASSPSSPAASAPNQAPGQPDERIIAYVESIRVMATRAAEGKVLMNDRFYRVNDVVERKLGVRLITVAAESLTFADANGVTYVKYF